ncbi:hypothetical protein SNEBB_010557 [Seison nebaliae]|nr:hypothetical protein SNEBB_010557 [Seison nebaliae]
MEEDTDQKLDLEFYEKNAVGKVYRYFQLEPPKIIKQDLKRTIEHKVEKNEEFCRIGENHLNSFNSMINGGLATAVNELSPIEFALNNKKILKMKWTDIVIDPVKCLNESMENTPKKCRLAYETYSTTISGTLVVTVHDYEEGETRELTQLRQVIGRVPVMVGSDVCSLRGATPNELMANGENMYECGGFFVIKGLEKLMRLLILPRRNYPLGVRRRRYISRGTCFTEIAIVMRCVPKTEMAITNTLHYVEDGSASLCVMFNKRAFFFPIILLLAALSESNNHFEIIKKIQHVQNCILNDHQSTSINIRTILKRHMEYLLEQQILGSDHAILYLGGKFKKQLGISEWTNDEESGRRLINDMILPHLKYMNDKFNMLLVMFFKAHLISSRTLCVENEDSMALHECLVPGQLFQCIILEKLIMFIRTFISFIKTDGTKDEHLINNNYLSSIFRKLISMDQIFDGLQYFLATGNLKSQSNFGLSQSSGMVIGAEKLNIFRYLAHFRSIHRGSFFVSGRTTSVRQLLPDSWGFICPVHTPDGTLCGLLNHLSLYCKVSTNNHLHRHYKEESKTNCEYTMELQEENISRLLISFNMTKVEDFEKFDIYPENRKKDKIFLPTYLNGRFLGKIELDDAMAFDIFARKMKCSNKKDSTIIPNTTEIILVKPQKLKNEIKEPVISLILPSLQIYCTPGRFIRPVLNLESREVEWIGTFEQLFLQIATNSKEFISDETRHMEINKYASLSIVASFTPFTQHNQSPRNMYQCQMGKQTMGTPSITPYEMRSDNKMYKVVSPQSPLVKTRTYDSFGIDGYPCGTNACIAVISSTAFDMEDAFVLNKQTVDRGYAEGIIIKSLVVDLMEDNRECYFGVPDNYDPSNSIFSSDGLPYVGYIMKKDDPFYSIRNMTTCQSTIMKCNSDLPMTIIGIRIVINKGHNNLHHNITKAIFTVTIERHITCGDKFASRAGQKGVCSRVYSTEDMPFTESGMIPDMIFNPHGIPSRMTVGMLLEIMAGKASAFHGKCVDSTSFIADIDDKLPTHEFLGELLKKTGELLDVDIFFGICYYQRLRHMISDKVQVRSTGPVDPLTKQPVKGRKRGGGIRLGEMERDALLSYGASMLIKERLLHSTDRVKTNVCTNCGNVDSGTTGLGFLNFVNLDENNRDNIRAQCRTNRICHTCYGKKNYSTINPNDNTKKVRNRTICRIDLPFVISVIAAELAGCGIKLAFNTKALTK